MPEKYIMALDQGTSGTRALVIDQAGHTVALARRDLTQYYPRPSWVEHDAVEIWRDQHDMIIQALEQARISAGQIEAIGITNQRETTVVWDADTGKPIHNAIVWQDKRTIALCETLRKQGLEDYIRRQTGLVLDAYFSGTKVKWILDNVSGAKEKAKAGKLRFGTIDSWLVWKLTRGKKHLTDYTNASRTMLFDIETLAWDGKILEALGIPPTMLPEVQASASIFGEFVLDDSAIPILGIAGDQQAALFGQHCTRPGMVKNTYGTGCFMLMHTGEDLHISDHGLLSTIACQADGSVGYALEGSIFIAGAVIQWLKDGLGILDDISDTEYYAQKAAEQEGLYMVPAFSGLGAPHWDMYARGAIMGITLDTNKEQIIRAALQSMAYQTRDVLEAMCKDTGLDVSVLRVDGGAAVNDYLMQFQADILKTKVERPGNIETTAMGAAYLAGLKSGFWTESGLQKLKQIDRIFNPAMQEERREILYAGWLKAVDRCKSWTND